VVLSTFCVLLSSLRCLLLILHPCVAMSHLRASYSSDEVALPAIYVVIAAGIYFVELLKLEK
jgi:hypothetical protein